MRTLQRLAIASALAAIAFACDTNPRDQDPTAHSAPNAGAAATSATPGTVYDGPCASNACSLELLLETTWRDHDVDSAEFEQVGCYADDDLSAPVCGSCGMHYDCPSAHFCNVFRYCQRFDGCDEDADCALYDRTTNPNKARCVQDTGACVQCSDDAPCEGEFYCDEGHCRPR